MNAPLHPDETVIAELHYTDFGSVEVFEELANRHGLTYAGETDHYPANPYMWVSNAATDDQLVLATNCNPVTGEHSNPRAACSREGYASYILLSGPVYAAEPLYRDIFATAEYIKGEFRPLSTGALGADEDDRTTVLDAEELGFPQPESSPEASSARDATAHRDPHPDESWPRYQDAPMCDECDSREAVHPTTVVDGTPEKWACFACSGMGTGALLTEGDRQ